MKSRIRIALGLIFTLGLISFATVPVFAGGWAVVTLDNLPRDVEANQPLEIGFMVRQHGVTPMSGQSPYIMAHLANSNQSVSVLASEQGKVGHYAATLTLPQAGEWEWSISAFTVNQPMPTLTVADAAVTVTKSEPATSSSNTLPLLAGGVGLLGAVGGLLASQRKVRWATALVMISLLISGVGFVSAVNPPKTKSETQAVLPLSSASQVELGHDLFIAKGCMLCHSHAETNSIREFGVDIGPDLTNFTASSEYLHLWLTDPRAAKSTATMPNLGLTEPEMEALIAFINDK